MNLCKILIGEQGFIILVGLILVISGLAFFYFVLRKNRLEKNIALLIIIILGLFLTWQLHIPEEKIHILEYAVLGWLAARDLVRREGRCRGMIAACIFCGIIGLLDEIFQGILPYRYFQWSDVMLNSLGGVWGIGLCLLSI